MGQRGVKWSDLATYVTQVRGLLAGDVVEVDGGACQLIHSPGFGPALPIEVPIGLAPMGPKGFAVSAELADVVILTGPPTPEQAPWDDIAMLVIGSVLDPGEDHTSERLRSAAGPFYVTTYHGIWEFAPEMVAGMPGGAEWLAALEADRPEGQRHLAVHEGHFVTVTDRDRPLLDAAGEGLLATGWTGTPEQVAERAEQAAAAGVTELAYVPAGPDIARELRAFAAAVRG